MRRLSLVTALLAGCVNDTSFSRLESPPELSILTPTPLQSYRKGEGPHTFVGTATDAYDDMATMVVRWSIDGGSPVPASVLADGNVAVDVDVELLELGEHMVELAAVDSDGDEALVGVPWILEGAISSPSVEITAPEDGSLYLPGEEITFRGEATDNNTDPDALVFDWSSSVDGPLAGAISGDGQSVLFHSGLSTGVHLVTLTVTDIDGEVGIDTVEVSVGEVVAEPEPGDLVFSELMINPNVVADEAGEWVELYNTAGYAIDVAGYSFHDLDFDLEILEGPLLVAPYDYIVLCADTDLATNGGVPCDGAFKREASGALALGNGADEVILSTPAGVVIDEVAYDEEWFQSGTAIGLDPSWLATGANDTPDNWCDQTTVISSGGEPGTPGRANDPC